MSMQHQANHTSTLRNVGVARICEITLQTRDVERLAHCCGDAFGRERISRQKDRIWLAIGSHARPEIWSPGKKKEFGDERGRDVHFAPSIGRGELRYLSERLGAMAVEHEGPAQHPGADRSPYPRDPAGNVAEVLDFFEHGEGARESVLAVS